jgi:predicted  nucleic acid-binding Zn-ribbon protein
LASLTDIESKGLRAQDVTGFLSSLDKSKIDPKKLLETYDRFASSGLTIETLDQVLRYRQELDRLGVTLKGLETVCRVSKQYGGYEGILKAIEGYGQLTSIQSTVTKLERFKDQLTENIADLKNTVDSLEDRRKKINDALTLYQTLQGQGFNMEVLKALNTTTERYGGMRNLLAAVNEYPNLVAVQKKTSDLETRRRDLKSEITKLENDHAQFKRVLTVCKSLLEEYGFTVSAIETLHRLCMSHGDALSVLEAVGKYRQLVDIQSEIETVRDRKMQLETEVKQLEVQSEKIQQVETRISDSLRTVGQIDEKIRRTRGLSIFLDLIERPAEVKEPMTDIMGAALVQVKALGTYLELHKDEAASWGIIRSELTDLSKLVTECLRSELRKARSGS